MPAPAAAAAKVARAAQARSAIGFVGDRDELLAWLRRLVGSLLAFIVLLLLLPLMAVIAVAAIAAAFLLGGSNADAGTLPAGSGIPPVYVPIYKAAARQWGVNWYLLASIHQQESSFGTLDAPGVRSGVNRWGCCAGPMQFNIVAGTWDGHKDAYLSIRDERPASYPLQAPDHPSPYDSFDAIAAAAHKLHQDGADASLYSEGSYRATCAYIGSCANVDACGGPNDYCQVLPRARAWETQGAAEGAGPSLRLPGHGGYWPTSPHGQVTSGYGSRRIGYHGGRIEFHGGIDIGVPEGSAVNAIEAGAVSLTMPEALSGGYGNYICIDHGNFESCYAHMRDRPQLTDGQHVAAGSRIGTVGQTGDASGPHLHFEIRMPGHGQLMCPAANLGLDPARYCTA